MNLTAVESWVEEPLRQFVDEARVILALLLYPNGQVVAQHGFTRSVDVMSACTLAAGIRASSGEIGRMLDGRPFTALHHAGASRQLFLAEVAAPRDTYVLLAVFDGESSLGIVRLYFDEFAARLAEAAPASEPSAPPLDQNFELELNRNLAALFGRG